MGDEKKFNKYKRYGGYHWSWYGKKVTYTRNADFLRDWVQEKNTIDIGAGDGFITYHLGIKGIDNDPYGVTIAVRKGVDVVLGDAYDLPYRDGEFDAALMTDVVEHFSQPLVPLAEARRVVKKYLYVNIPKNEKFVEPDHYHAWTPEEFINEVEGVGFALEQGPITQHNKHYFKFRKK